MTLPTAGETETDNNIQNADLNASPDFIDVTTKIILPPPAQTHTAVVTCHSEKSKEPAPHPVIPQTWTRPAPFWLSLESTARTPAGTRHLPKETFPIFREK